MNFLIRPESFCIHRLPPDGQAPLDRLAATSWYSITRTPGELSVIAPAGIDLGPGEREPGWSCLQVEGPLDFGMVGVIAGIAKTLADAQVSIFAVSTYDTDYFLVRTADVDKAVGALRAAGHAVLPHP